MPSVKQTVIATTTQEIRLAPKVRQRLLMELRVYKELKAQRDAIDSAMEKHKGVIGAIRDDTGEMSLSIEGFKTTLVAGSRKKFDPKKFVTLGGDLDTYNAAVTEKLNKPYEKITCPGDKETDYDQD